MVPAKVAGFSLHASFFLRFVRRTKLRRKPPMGTEGHETCRFLPSCATHDALHSRCQVVVAQPLEDTGEVGKGSFMRFEKRLLGRVGKSAVKGGATGHTAHGKHLQL